VALVKYRGVEYRNRSSLCRVLGINYDTVNMRMSRGLTLHKAITFKPKSSLRYNKTIYRSYSDLIKRLGLNVSLSQFMYRLKICNGSISKAIRFKPRFGAFEFNGVTYSSKRDLCTKMGLNYQTFMRRIRLHNMALKRAVREGQIDIKLENG